MDEWNELIRLALARYGRDRNSTPQLALRMFWSDRRAAGLGALEPGKRRPVATARPRVSRLKIEGLDRGKVEYLLRRDTLQAIDPASLPNLTELRAGVPGSRTYRTIQVAGYDYAVPFDVRELHSQRGRTAIARQLRAIRREIYRLHRHEEVARCP